MVAKTGSFRNPGRGEALLAPCALALCLLFPAVAGGTDPVFELGSLLEFLLQAGALLFRLIR